MCQGAIQSFPTQFSLHQMTTFSRSQSRAITSYSDGHAQRRRKDSVNLQLKDFYLRKSLFNPPQGLAEAYASRRHIAGAEVPIIEIVYSNPRWLLLQAPQNKANFFQKLNQNRLSCKEDHILKIFKNFVSLVRHFGFFRPTEKMIFLEKMETKVWISEDIFSIVPAMPIVRGADGEKHFVIAFLAMVQTYLNKWDRVSNVTTIDDALKMLEWRSQLAKGSKNALRVSCQVNYKPGQSQISFPSEDTEHQRVTSSQQLSDSKQKEEDTPRMTFNTSKHSSLVGISSSSFKIIRASIQLKNHEENAELRGTKLKFALNSTTSTLGAFCDKWRTTAGRKKLIEKSESHDPISPPASQQGQSRQGFPGPAQMQMEFEDLFADEQQGYDEAELQRITEQIQEILIW